MNSSLAEVLKGGCSVEYKNSVFIDPINMRGVPKRTGYQVICQRQGKEFSALYYDSELEVAVDKFLLLKSKL